MVAFPPFAHKREKRWGIYSVTRLQQEIDGKDG
jgi:hypothetical protein